MFSTILFDLDGVVVDSEPVHAMAKKLTLDKSGIKYPESVFDDFKGKTDDEFFKYVSAQLDRHNRPYKVLLEEKQSTFIRLLPEMKLIDGFLPFIKNVKSRGIKTALVSSTSVYSLKLIDKVFQITDLFELIVTEDDTSDHKPHPAPYLKALEKLPASPEYSVVIEDSPSGIRSARKAGCKVYALTTSFPASRLGEADEIFNSYNEIYGKLYPIKTTLQI